LFDDKVEAFDAEGKVVFSWLIQSQPQAGTASTKARGYHPDDVSGCFWVLNKTFKLLNCVVRHRKHVLSSEVPSLDHLTPLF
jgi:hypothetical protein